jgi:glycosyltransferase 2 family protein
MAKYKKYYKNPTLQLTLAGVLFLIAWGFSRLAPMTSIEIWLFNLIYGLPNFLQPFFITITQFGNIYFLAFVVMFFMFKQRYHVAIRLLLSGALAYLVTGVAKDLWGRERPYELLANTVSRELYVRGPGFPSGHMALATAIGLTLAHYVPKKYHYIIWLLIAGVGISRIYLGVHAPLDILGGFAIGWAAYSIFMHVKIYNNFTSKQSSKVLTKKR